LFLYPTLRIKIITLLLNYHLLSSILVKARFNPKVSIFFYNYLVDRKTKYLWNNFFSSFFNVGIGVGQGLVLSPILSALYLLSIFHIFKNQLKNLKIPISTIFFVNNSLFIAQNKFISVSNTNIFCSYNVISKLLTKFSLTMEHRKIEMFHFSRLHSIFNPPPLDLTLLGGPVLCSKNA